MTKANSQQLFETLNLSPAENAALRFWSDLIARHNAALDAGLPPLITSAGNHRYGDINTVVVIRGHRVCVNFLGLAKRLLNDPTYGPQIAALL